MSLKLNPITGRLDVVRNISDLVPYTGATTDVDLGGHSLTIGVGGSLVVNTLAPDIIDFYTENAEATSWSNLTVAYNEVLIDTPQLRLVNYSAGFGDAILDVSGVTLTKTFTFPDATGTLALEDDYKRFSFFVGR